MLTKKLWFRRKRYGLGELGDGAPSARPEADELRRGQKIFHQKNICDGTLLHGKAGLLLLYGQYFLPLLL
jgi:hypothetical protein